MRTMIHGFAGGMSEAHSAGRRKHAQRTSALVAALVPFLWACGSSTQRTTSVPFPDTLTVDLNIGRDVSFDQGNTDYQFSQIWDIESDSAGNIYVLENSPPSVVVFDDDGQFKFRIGRRGEGPGEFVFPQRLTWLGEDLAVLDPGAGRLTMFNRDGAYVDSHTASTWRMASELAWVHNDVIAVQVGPVWNFRDPRNDGKASLLLVELPGHVADTIVTWVDSIAAPVRLGQDGVEVVVTVPYGLRGVWGVIGSEIVFGIGNEYRLRRFVVRGRSAEPKGDLRRHVPRWPPSPRETDRMREKIDSYEAIESTPVPYAARKPIFDRIVVRNDGGGLWIRTFGRENAVVHHWDVYDCKLQYRGAVVVPAEPRIEGVSATGVYGSATGAFGVRYLERYGMPTEFMRRGPKCDAGEG